MCLITKVTWNTHFKIISHLPSLPLQYSTSRILKVALLPGNSSVFRGPFLCFSESRLEKLDPALLWLSDKPELFLQWLFSSGIAWQCILEKQFAGLVFAWSHDNSVAFSSFFWSTGRISGNSLNSQLRSLKNLFLWIL